jgi:hypothetical protein
MEDGKEFDSNDIKDEFDVENIQSEYNRLNEKSVLFKLKRWEKKLMKKLRKLYLNITFIFEQKKEIKRQNQILNEEIKKEMDNLELEKKEIIQEKEASIKKLEIEREKLIKESDKKLTDILSYLDSIKNDRIKLIEFLSRKKIY